MTTHFMRSYARAASIKTCHRRDVHAMGGMAAQIPIKNDEAANAEAFAKVQADKEREATDGHDGTWVAHPGLVPVALEAFDRLHAGAEPDRSKKREDVNVTAADLLKFEPEAPITEKGLRLNINVGDPVHRRVARGAGRGADLQPDGRRGDRRDLALAGLAVDPLARRACSTTAARSTKEMVARDDPRGDAEDPRPARRRRSATGKYDDAAAIFADLVNNDTFVEFLTLPAYDRID